MLMGGEETGSYEVCISHYLGDINCPSNNITAQPLLLLLDSLHSLAACCGRWWICSPVSRILYKNIFFSQIDMRAVHQVS